MAENLSVYIPMDRRLALACGKGLPERAHGVALFADISGFTPLTEALALELGPRRGAEELSIHLNRVNEALITQLHRFGGSVIGFCGDAITCWLDGDDGSRGIAAALAMQAAMEQFSAVSTYSGKVFSLGIKVAVVTGPVRRFLVGDPDYVVMDVMAGATLEKLAAAEDLAERGDVVIDQGTAVRLGEHLEISAWREVEATGERFALVKRFYLAVPDSPWPNLSPEALGVAETRAWLLPRIHERLQRGLGEFLAELRPAVAFFLRFSGIDYDNDLAAPQKLDTLVRAVEQILTKYDGSITHLTIGDKGSYFCIVFGAPVSHEDNSVRACAASLEMREALNRLGFIDTVQIGITQGRLWTGAYGSSTRRTYDILGDDANLAARLMSIAKPGQILATDRVTNTTGDAFRCEGLDKIQVKGKTLETHISQLLDTVVHRVSQLRIPSFSLPMVGRTEELNTIRQKLEQAIWSHGQIVGITSEAGVGKSRLAAEVIRLASEMQFIGYGGECQSYGTNSSYLVWHTVWRSFFGLDASMSREYQIQVLTDQLRQINPALVQRLPLLGTALNIPIPDNTLTTSLNAKVRKSSLEAMLVECLQARARTQPVLVVLEDCHWLDPLSHDLLEAIGRSTINSSVVLLVIYRPPKPHHLQALRVSTLPNFTEINLVEFTAQEADQLIQMKLEQFFGPNAQVSLALIERITTQAAGNPFYIEELLNYLGGLGVDPMDQETLESLDLPGSITSLILSRMDQLTEGQQITIKVASVIGRLFPAAIIWGIYPKLGDEHKVREHLDIMQRLELTVLDTPEPELTYLFKHVFTQEVAYNSLPYATRSMLHEAIGGYIEGQYGDILDEYTNILAHHYEHTENKPKKRHYLLKAGETAQKDYANAAAINYYKKVLPLLPDQEQVDVHLKLGKVLELIGEWEEAGDVYQLVLTQAETLGDTQGCAWAETAMGEFFRKQGRFEDACKKLLRAQELFAEIDDLAGVGQVLHYQGSIADQQGEFERARELMEASLVIRQRTGDKRQSAYLLGNLGIVARRQGNLSLARKQYEQSLKLRREINDRWGVANVLNNLGNLWLDLDDQKQARSCLEEAVAIHQELGDRWATGNALNNLANVFRQQGNYPTAKELYNKSLAIYRDLGDKWALAYLFEDVAWLAALQCDGLRAVRLRAAGAILRDEISAPLTNKETEKLETALHPTCSQLDPDEGKAAYVEGEKMNLEEAITYAMS